MTTDRHAQDNRHNLLCPGGDTKDSEQDCYQKNEIEKAIGIIKELYSDLSARKGQVECGEAAETTQRMTKSEFMNSLKKQERDTAERMFKCCVSLIIANPHWNIRALDNIQEELQNVSLASKMSYLYSTVASMSFMCRFRRSFTRVIWSIFVLVAGVAGLGVLFLLLWWRIQAKEKEEQKVFAMVEQIIDLLKEQHEFARKDGSLDQATGLAVQHVRDQLLPPATRKANQHIWDKAVKFIEANESRVRLETQVIEGEEFAVWRWIQAVPNGGKVWQGQAFGEHNENNAAASVYSPTPCLKIRNMFDKEVENEEDWEESVKDALLEKCRDIKSLVHIYVDKNSREGCVYVKCNSKEAAGLVRQALHGWWFDGRLVTVKHLKVEHYHNRWPEAKFAWRPLQPSTDQMRSLAQPYYRSSLEMT
nr:hypothetical protein BaRGS_028140 [Batillaria attramentaria]